MPGSSPRPLRFHMHGAPASAPAPATDPAASNPRARCIHCEYSLGALPFEGLCPECGAQYNKAELELLWHHRTTKWLNPPNAHAVPPAAKRAMRVPFQWVLASVGVAIAISIIAHKVDWLLLAVPLALVAIVGVIAHRTSQLTELLESTGDCACTNCGFDLRFRPECGICPACGGGYHKAACLAAWRGWRAPGKKL